ncbi:MAG: hypothetical protein OXC54_00745 [Rhodospirillaceae bacterium]|nr:hypothetical protein [Rhodospirillaceae bacterium]MCY4309837.1 hypothetical protein [Rhodospirillaceae bacterium]
MGRRRSEFVDKQVCQQLKTTLVAGEHENRESQKESIADVQKVIESPNDAAGIDLLLIASLVYVLDDVG